MSKKDEIIKEIEDELRDIEMSVDNIRDQIREFKKLAKHLYLPSDTVTNQMKAEFILENWEKITLEQLEGLV